MPVTDARQDKYDFQNVNLFQNIMMIAEENDSNNNYEIPSLTQKMMVPVTDGDDYNRFCKLCILIALPIIMTMSVMINMKIKSFLRNFHNNENIQAW